MRTRVALGSTALLASLLVGGMAVRAPAAADAPAPAAVQVSALTQKGAFEGLTEPMNKLIQITLKGSAASLNRAQWGQEKKDDKKAGGEVRARIRMGAAGGGGMIIGGLGGEQTPVEKVFAELQANAGAHSTGMSLSGERRQVSFSGGSLSGALNVAGDAVNIELREESGPGRTLSLSDDGKGSLRLLIAHPDGDMVLLSQSRKGPATVAVIAGGQVSAASGKSYLELYRDHRTLLDQQVFPVLKQIGVGLAVSPNTPQVRRAVLALLAPLSPADKERGQRLFSDLDSDEFQVREEATKALGAEFERFQGMIQAKLAEPEASMEVKERLAKILGDHPDDQKVHQIIAALKLTEDPAYIVGLLPEAGAGDRPVLVAKLQQLTGQKIGDDPAAWQAWLSKPSTGR